MCGYDHFTKDCPRCEEVNRFLKNNPTLTVLTDPFPSQQQFIDHMYLHGDSSSMEEKRMMTAETVGLTTRTQKYNKTPEKNDECTSYEKDSPTNHVPSLPPSTSTLTIEKLIPDAILRPPKSMIQKTVFNPSA